jgi:hypothetical protein
MIKHALNTKNEPIIDNSVANLTVTEIMFKLKRDKRNTNPTLAENENVKLQMIQKLKRELRIYENTKLQIIQKLKRELRIYKHSHNNEELSRLRNRMDRLKIEKEELEKKNELLKLFFETY